MKNMTEKQRVKSFSPEKALEALSANFFREDACRDWLLKTLHPDGAHCPGCGTRLEDKKSVHNFWNLRRCECKVCKKWFSATSGTILHGAQLNMRQTFLLIFLLSLGIDDRKIAEICGISSGTVRLWRMRFSVVEERRLFKWRKN